MRAEICVGEIIKVCYARSVKLEVQCSGQSDLTSVWMCGNVRRRAGTINWDYRLHLLKFVIVNRKVPGL